MNVSVLRGGHLVQERVWRSRKYEWANSGRIEGTDNGRNAVHTTTTRESEVELHGLRIVLGKESRLRGKLTRGLTVQPSSCTNGSAGLVLYSPSVTIYVRLQNYRKGSVVGGIVQKDRDDVV